MYALDTRLTESVRRYFDLCREHADYITDHPELGCEEHLACGRYVKLLEEHGWQVETPVAGVPCSFRAVRKDRLDDAGPRAVLMCEYDALPEVGHGCGHSMSGSASLLAALALADAYPDLPLRIDLMGTPGEEYPGGKVMLADAGAFGGYEFAAMAHMMDYNAPGFGVLACNDRYITFRGKAAHASAMPEKGINALNAARIFMDAMDMWRQHLPKYSQIHGVVAKGGDLPSIVPDDVELNYYFRARTLKELLDLNTKAEKCAEGAALCTGCTCECAQQYLTYADLSNPPAGLEALRDIFDALDLPVREPGDPSGSTDAGNVDQIIPTFHPLVSVSGGRPQVVHDKGFTALMKCESGYRGLYNAAVLLASFALRLAGEPERLAEIQRWHQEYRGL